MARVIGGDGYYMVTPPLGYKGKTYVNGRYVYEHRLLMEQKLGRVLEKGEIVDHINGNKFDNDLSNLQVLSIAAHGAKTAEQLGKCGWQNPNCECSNCGKEFHIRPWKLKNNVMFFHNRECYLEFIRKNNPL